MDLCAILVGVAVLLLAYLCMRLTKNRGHIEALGIPMVKPVLVFGSPPFGLHKVYIHTMAQENFRRYGKTYGKYEGVIPVVVTIDTDIIKSVLVKNFDSFSDLHDMELSDRYQTLDISGGEMWRGLRKNLSPIFSSGKLKGMLELMTGVGDGMMAYVDEVFATQKEDTDLKPVFQGLALNTIAKCAFGIETDAYHDREQDLIKYGTEIFAGFRASSWTESLFFQAFSHLPGLEKVLPFMPPAYDKFFDITKDIIRAREESGTQHNYNDFLARLMDMLQAKRDKDQNLEAIKEDNILAQGTIFFVAGYETTANTLSTLCYNMARNPEVQERLHADVVDVMEAHGSKVDHETIGEMVYLDAALSESLRLNGPVTTHFRLCTKDCEVVPGMMIKKGVRVEMPVYASHHHPDYFPDPERFLPERFLKENKESIQKYTYRPFGDGPRMCIGLRFAQVEMKIAVAKLVSKYRLKVTPNTKLDLYKGDPFLLSYPEMRIRLEKRE